MPLPSSIEPFLEPETIWHESPPPAPTTATLVVAVIAVGVVALILWDDLARTGPWPGVAGPREVASIWLRVNVAWLIAAVMSAAAVGAWLARPRDAPIAAAIDRPLLRLPVFLRFDGRRVIVVGGGPIAAAKIPALLDAGADVTVVAPHVDAGIDRTRVRVVERAFTPSDLDGAWFVTAASTPAINEQVRAAAETRAVFVNAVDDSANATAYLGGAVARGGVTVAFSTAGKAPALAGLLREALDAIVPQDIETWVAQAHELSRQQRREGVPMGERRPQLLDALNDLYGSRERAAKVSS